MPSFKSVTLDVFYQNLLAFMHISSCSTWTPNPLTERHQIESKLEARSSGYDGEAFQRASVEETQRRANAKPQIHLLDLSEKTGKKDLFFGKNKIVKIC